ncbi:hypothetical protein JCM9279_000484 [Rhodotorula babjevae]
MSSRWSALLSSTRPSPTTLPPLHRRTTPPPHSVPRSLHEPTERDLVPGRASADSPGVASESPVRPPGAALSEPPQLWSTSTSLAWLESSEHGVDDGTGGLGASTCGSRASRPERTSRGTASKVDARSPSGYTFAPPLEQHDLDGRRAEACDDGEAVHDEATASSDIGGEFTFSFDSPVLVATRAADEHGFEYGSPDMHVPYSPSEHLEPVSPISPLSGLVEQGRPTGGSYFPQQQADHAVSPSSSLYQGPASAPTYSHEPYYPGAASYPPSFAAAPVPLSMAAYQSFAYAQTSTSSEHYVSATAYDDGDDGASGYPGFAPSPASSSFHPAQARRISTGGIFPHFYSPSHASATYRFVRAPSPPRSPASLLAVNLPFVGSTSPPLEVKAELDDVDLPSPPPQLPHAPAESLYGSPMSASSFGSGGLSAWSFGVGSGDEPGSSSSAPQRVKTQHAHRRVSRAPDDLDPDYEPSPPPPSSLESHPKIYGSSSRPISPITGKPVKKISKRGWPPKDAHKRVFECEVEGCGKKFGRPSARDTHMRSHTGVKPFTCPIPTCARSFGVFSNLKRHMIVHPTVDFRQVSVHDLPHMRFVPDRPGAVQTSDGGRLEWIEDGDDETPQQEGSMQE